MRGSRRSVKWMFGVWWETAKAVGSKWSESSWRGSRKAKAGGLSREMRPLGGCAWNLFPKICETHSHLNESQLLI